MRGLNKRVEDGLLHLGTCKVNVVDEPVYAGANGALQLAVDMPGEYWQPAAINRQDRYLQKIKNGSKPKLRAVFFSKECQTKAVSKVPRRGGSEPQ